MVGPASQALCEEGGSGHLPGRHPERSVQLSSSHLAPSSLSWCQASGWGICFYYNIVCVTLTQEMVLKMNEFYLCYSLQLRTIQTRDLFFIVTRISQTRKRRSNGTALAEATSFLRGRNLSPNHEGLQFLFPFHRHSRI